MHFVRKCANNLFSRWRISSVLVIGFIVWTVIYLNTVPARTVVVRTICENFESPTGNSLETQRDLVSEIKELHQDGEIGEGIVSVKDEFNNPEQSGKHHSSYGHCQSEDFGHFDSETATSMKYFTDDFDVTEEPFKSWLSDKKNYCEGAVRTYGDKFGIVQGVMVNPKERVGADTLAKGGEGIHEVKSQNVNKEDYSFKRGFFEVVCKDTGASELTARAQYYDRINQLRAAQEFKGTEAYTLENKFTIAIARGDYANFWNHMFELYGVFVLMMIFNKRPEDVSVLFLDGHPACLLDRNWEHIFGPIQRVGRFEKPVLYQNLVWGLAENQIPLSKWKNPSCPYVEEFRTFVLNQYDIVENAKKLNCRKLMFTFIVRRNQVYHPRNLEGDVQRKIFNELEVIEMLMEKFPGVCIQALLMESIPMRAQMEIISETDVLLGMHGAGMMHTTFLPRHAGVVELFPRDWRKTRPFSVMYEVMSLKWRNLKYGYWQNPDKEREFSEKITIVDIDKVYSEVKKVINQMCGT